MRTITPVNANRIPQIKALAISARQERINILTNQLQNEINAAPEDADTLETETIEMRGLFEVLDNFTGGRHVEFTMRLNSLLQAYIKLNPKDNENVLKAYEDINLLVSGLYYYRELIQNKHIELSKLEDDLEIYNTHMQQAS